MTAEEFMGQIKRKLEHGDGLISRKRYAEAIETYTELVDLLHAMEQAQDPVRSEGPTDVPLSLRLMMANRLRIVPLQRLAHAYLHIGDRAEALICLREIVKCLETAVRLAGRQTKADFEKELATARAEVEELELEKF